MPITAEDVATLHQYAQGVMERAHHHATDVEAVCLTMLGGVVWRADPGSISIKQYAGRLANVLWFSVCTPAYPDGTPPRRRGPDVLEDYAMAYNHSTGLVEIRERVLTGRVLHELDNMTPHDAVRAIFAGL